jgi:hypothetical protein
MFLRRKTRDGHAGIGNYSPHSPTIEEKPFK